MANNGVRREEEQENEARVFVEVEDVVSASSFAAIVTQQRSPVTEPPCKSRIQKNSKNNTSSIATIQKDAFTPQPMLASRAVPLLVCSIGNPGSAYANTLHSAGHTVLNCLRERLNYPGFHKEKAFGNGLLSSDHGGWTLWQSTSYMNESGKGVRAAYLAWSKNLPAGEGKLVIVHDELEKPLGAVSVRTAQGASAKGHNGLKSIMSLMGNTPFARIGIGIGRPASRTSDDVARYVLKRMDPVERVAIEASVEQIIAKLKQLEEG